MLVLVEAFGARVTEAETPPPIALSAETTSDLTTQLLEHLRQACRAMRFACFLRYSPPPPRLDLTNEMPANTVLPSHTTF
jgi:hypothetical protein